MADPPEFKSLERLLSSFVISSDPAVAVLVGQIATRACAAVDEQRAAIAAIRETISDERRWSSQAAAICREALKIIEKEHDRVAQECWRQTTHYIPIADELMNRIGRGRIRVPRRYPIKLSDLWNGENPQQRETLPEVVRRAETFRTSGCAAPFGTDEFCPGRFDTGLFRPNTYNVQGHIALWTFEDGARAEIRQLLDVYTEEARFLADEFAAVSLPDLDLDDDGRPEMEQEVNEAVEQALASAPFVNTVEPVGDLPVPGGAPVDSAGGGGGEPEDPGGGDYLDGNHYQPFDQGADDAGYGTAAAGGGGGPPGAPFRSDGVGGSPNTGLIRPSGVAGGGPGVPFGPGVVPYGLGGGVPPGGLSGANAAAGPPKGALVELDRDLLGAANVAPPGIIDSAPTRSIDDSTRFV